MVATRKSPRKAVAMSRGRESGSLPRRTKKALGAAAAAGPSLLPDSSAPPGRRGGSLIGGLVGFAASPEATLSPTAGTLGVSRKRRAAPSPDGKPDPPPTKPVHAAHQKGKGRATASCPCPTTNTTCELSTRRSAAAAGTPKAAGLPADGAASTPTPGPHQASKTTRTAAGGTTASGDPPVDDRPASPADAAIALSCGRLAVVPASSIPPGPPMPQELPAGWHRASNPRLPHSESNPAQYYFSDSGLNQWDMPSPAQADLPAVRAAATELVIQATKPSLVMVTAGTPSARSELAAQILASKRGILGLKTALGAAQEERRLLDLRVLMLDDQVVAHELQLQLQVNAPLSSGADVTEWIPDELLLHVLGYLSMRDIYRACVFVNKRWWRLVASNLQSQTALDRGLAQKFGKYTRRVKHYEPPQKLTGHTDTVGTLAVGLDGRIFSGSHDEHIRVWKKDGTFLRQLNGHAHKVSCLAVGADGILYSGSWDQRINVWGVDGALLATLDAHDTAVCSLAVDRNSNQLYSASSDSKIIVWGEDGDGGFGARKQLRTLEGHTAAIFALQVAHDGRLYSGSHDYSVRIWSKAGKQLNVLNGHTKPVCAIQTCKNANRLYTASYDFSVRVWTLDGDMLMKLEGHRDAVFAIAVTPNGQLFTGSHDHLIKAWSLDGSELITLTGHDDTVRALASMPDGRICSGSTDTTVRIWG